VTKVNINKIYKKKNFYIFIFQEKAI